ncbi:16S rRNA m(7)G-527 methyltransferase [Olsenella sp. KH3B4]|uniref:16S rRNA (guanine(527)-N(7))-methyltransferase RsmG n=1 Tax=Olsenella sp. KH3B4 TaxID=1855394 RepID=UPI0008B331B6|nr:16S rRNA (guanine(527)-N(7))-methyltransferase RsmG [Olsenella sp. KH3B4]SET13447.1 16S rRNA m(7)G-527 methyltransferase [Olsenella sp. KH3B4]
MNGMTSDTSCKALRELIAHDADLSRINVSDKTIDLLVHHLELVIEKNKVMNLTRITNEHEALVLHIIDSLLFVAHAPTLLKSDSSLLDIGTGAGFPGIPLTLVSGCKATLIDSVGKKVSAVQDFVDELGLSDRISCVHARAEEVPSLCDSRFDVVVARAVAQTNVLIEYATPCLRKNGTLLVGKGNPTTEELIAANRAAKICGLEESGLFEYELPSELGHRTILVYTKTGNPRIKLPRQIGMAKRAPLGIE